MRNIDFEVRGDLALFTNSFLDKEKGSYQIPTNEALKGILKNVYWKPTIIWHIDKCRVMNPIKLVQKNGHTYLSDVRYQVSAHFSFNKNREYLKCDWNENKHMAITERYLARGGRRDIFLGTHECKAFVKPCRFGEESGYYDDAGIMNFEKMFYGFVYPDEAFSKETKGHHSTLLFVPTMENGIITYPEPRTLEIASQYKSSIKKIGEAR